LTWIKAWGDIPVQNGIGNGRIRTWCLAYRL